MRPHHRTAKDVTFCIGFLSGTEYWASEAVLIAHLLHSGALLPADAGSYACHLRLLYCYVL